ncbi:hypothetical protein RJ639_011232 [Escallonia herrerae]|uniref:Pentatricopeptide repeat-containing protein-mitochondrial domain-containing protein n=1 Tax=Escallonia herrerae TaxID=1293975 RepID=A0AA88VVP4_9ASTE|nr:hypothetical protein RJ639_011232 [Escallonia herrerae]
MNSFQFRRISTLLDSAKKPPNSSQSKSTRRNWDSIPLPHRTLAEPRGQDLDYVNVAHSHLVHSDWTKLDKLVVGLTPFRIKHILLKVQKDYVISYEFFKWVQLKNPSSLTLETHSIIVHVLTKNHKFKSTEAILRKILEPGSIDLPLKLFDAVLHSYRMCESSPRVFDALFKTYAHMKKFRNATDTFYWMKDYGFLPTVESCNAYMRVLIDSNRADIALAFYKEIRSSRILLNVYTLNMAVHAHCKLGKVEKAVEEMQKNGIVADILTYNALILGLCKKGKTKKAAYLVKELDRKNLVPNSSTFSALISGQCVRKNPDRAFQLYKSMISSGCRPNEPTLKMLLSTFCENGDYDGAVQVLREMLERSITPDSAIFSELCNGLHQYGKDEMVLKLSKEVDAKHVMPEGSGKAKSLNS